MRYKIKLLLNNLLVNNILVLLKADYFINKLSNPYLKFKPAQQASLQQIAGFSHRPEIDEVLQKNHDDLAKIVQTYVPKGGKILDIGCGPGLYLKDFSNEYECYGQDISKTMIDIAKEQNPKANFIQGSILEVELPNELDLIYCIGVLIYIPPSQLPDFFKKVFAALKPGGIFYLNYPHAIRFLDLLYPDITYVQYSPKKIEQISNKYSDLIIHHHAVDERKVSLYDKTPYKSLNPTTHRTYRNSYLLVAKKR